MTTTRLRYTTDELLTDLVEAACLSALANQTGARFDRILEYRLAQVRSELAAHAEGERLTAEFDALATRPAEVLT